LLRLGGILKVYRDKKTKEETTGWRKKMPKKRGVARVAVGFVLGRAE